MPTNWYRWWSLSEWQLREQEFGMYWQWLHGHLCLQSRLYSNRWLMRCKRLIWGIVRWHCVSSGQKRPMR
ncbi:hypothetical protein DPMN_114717 [Dreissena polymorpha]|uniref:Uncharacterized protein n=1 Tax=Dreissena polymorpha TaxID=45954 RepID=A0A9D4QSB0_DREPO|nr:hypothetical protein DPMN_114717 [Dreissena polymorpha]